MLTTYKIEERLQKKGFYPNRTGSFSSVYISERKRVVKIGNGGVLFRDGWIAFADLCHDLKHRNFSCLPRIDSLRWRPGDGYIAVIEKLDETFEDRFDYQQDKTIFDEVYDCMESYGKKVPERLFLNAGISNREEVIEVLEIFRQFLKVEEGTFNHDNHSANLMFRGDQLVFIDPFYDIPENDIILRRKYVEKVMKKYGNDIYTH